MDALPMPEARYKQVVDRLAADIRDGRLLPGTRLPTHRELAAQEGLALVTATRVYAELHTMARMVTSNSPTCGRANSSTRQQDKVVF
jgi:DNA-binding transcriptional regulator YhcF (GntR family)